ncbi:unnamed protein product [Trichogramma brassicae]|uniref:Uncharacterized protein n=1 Tax=Trichogramma brassicae TaxID=86971 RepID=A0A6H5IBS2_9HYME|nr:unnamed protein product [Trichogramma brassicae]
MGNRTVRYMDTSRSSDGRAITKNKKINRPITRPAPQDFLSREIPLVSHTVCARDDEIRQKDEKERKTFKMYIAVQLAPFQTATRANSSAVECSARTSRRNKARRATFVVGYMVVYRRRAVPRAAHTAHYYCYWHCSSSSGGALAAGHTQHLLPRLLLLAPFCEPRHLSLYTVDYEH